MFIKFIYGFLFIIVNGYNACAGKCPITLNNIQLIQLDKKGSINFEDRQFLLDGSSRKLLNKEPHIIIERDTEPYQQNLHGKMACWYRTKEGSYIGIREK